MENVGQDGWAHSGTMVARELDEIVDERERIWALVVGVSNGGAVPSPEPVYEMYDDSRMEPEVA